MFTIFSSRLFQSLTTSLPLYISPVFLSSMLLSANPNTDIDEIVVIAEQLFKDTSIVSPSSMITAEQLATINITTTEDALAHEPSLIVRKRFIGDPNGVVGIRGSNMFQTTRSMVFTDGMPLHYHLQTRFRGAPRWSLVSPSEIDNVEVIYGPFSSEYSGNAMGGVVNINTRRPSSKMITLEAGYFSQQYDQFETHENYDGYRTFASYENIFGDLGLMLSHTRIDNDSQPQTQLFAQAGSGSANASVSSGAIVGINETGDAGIYFADSGPEQATSDLYKIKSFYDLDNAQLRASIAYENRTRLENQHNNFLKDNNGNLIFDRRIDINGAGLVYDTYQYGRSRLQHRSQERESLLLGLGLSLELNNNWVSDIFYSYFSILNDSEIRSGNNPASDNYISDNASYRARITEYDDTGWQIFDAKFATDNLAGNDKQRLSLGLHYDQYELNYIVDDYNSITGERDSDETDNNPATGRSDSGGKASTTALFAQYGYQLNNQWDLSAGLRFEDWKTKEGFIGSTQTASRKETGLSPKLSIAWTPNTDTEVRYSAAKALRFPIIEELYVNVDEGAGASIISDPTLKPEAGIFHNLSLSYATENGSTKINAFYEIVDDVIFNQRSTTGVSTFLPVGEVTTQGVEFIIEQRNMFNSALNIRYNITFTDEEITDNIFNRSFEGNEFPRTPQWRSHLLMTYPINDSINIGSSVRYASNSYGTLDNSDNVDNVFGAQDDFLFFGAKVNWQVNTPLKVSVGIDNIFDDKAYVFHPWPGRTFHLQARYQIGE